MPSLKGWTALALAAASMTLAIAGAMSDGLSAIGYLLFSANAALLLAAVLVDPRPWDMRLPRMRR